MAYLVFDPTLLSLTPGTSIEGQNLSAGGDAPNEVFDIGTGNLLSYEEVSGPGTGYIRAYSPVTGTDGNSQIRWVPGGTPNAVAMEVEFRPQKTLVTQSRLLSVNTATNYAVRVEMASDYTLRIYTPGTGSNNDMTGTVPASTVDGFRVYLGVTTGTNGSQTVDVRLYNGEGGKSTTVAEQLLSTTADTQTDAINLMVCGLINNAGEGTFEIQNVQINDSAIGTMGPLLDPPVISGTPQDILGFDLAGLVSGGSGAPYTMSSVTQTGGTTVSGLGYSTANNDLRGWCDRDSVVDTCTFDVVVLDSTSTASAAFEVTLVPSSTGVGGPYIRDDTAGLYV